MLTINWTPFARTYRIPFIQGKKNKSLWFVDIRLFRVQICLYSRKMGYKILEATKKGLGL